MATPIEQAREKFNEFLSLMDDQLEWLQRQAAGRGISLAHRREDLPALERLFDALAEGLDKPSIERLSVACTRHLGDTVRRVGGGRWALSSDGEKGANFGLPVITGHSPVVGLEFSPLLVMRAYQLRRRPGTLARAVDADIKPRALDLDDLIEE